MKPTFLALFPGLALGLALGGPGIAQTANCAPHDLVVARLASGYGESRQSIAMGANNTVVEVFASVESGSWTITVTAPGGLTCLVASGQAYEYLAEALPNTDPGA